MSDRIVIAGSLAQRPGQGGHTWVFLQYLLGFRRLGYEVLFIDRLEPEMCADERGAPCSIDDSVNLRYFTRVLEQFGLSDSYALVCEGGSRFVGLSRARTLDRVREAALVLNVMGFLDDEEILASAQRRVFLDIDPGFGQMWRELGLADIFCGHDDYVTVGMNVGREGCEVPTCGLDWITTPPPVVLDEWPARFDKGRGAFTSVASWRGPFGPINYEGQTYGLRVHEFRKFAPLPKITNRDFEAALDIDPTDEKDLMLLRENGWQLTDPREAAGDPFAYRSYIRESAAEFMVAKGMYVQTRGGWFSDRSACYLASGRPVVAQDTGFTDHFKTGEGLLSFSTIEEAAARVEEVSRDYALHSRAARRVAEECFDAEKVLRRLLGRLGVA